MLNTPRYLAASEAMHLACRPIITPALGKLCAPVTFPFLNAALTPPIGEGIILSRIGAAMTTPPKLAAACTLNPKFSL